MIITLKIYFLSHFHIFNLVLLSYSHYVVHYIPKTHLFCNWSLHLFTNYMCFAPQPLSSSPHLGQLQCVLCFCNFFFGSTYKWDYRCISLISLSMMFSRSIYFCSKWKVPFLWLNNILLGIYYHFFVYPFIH